MRDVPAHGTLFDLVIIGAGPSGLAAAATAARLQLSVALVDEQNGPGGQIYRSVEDAPENRTAILGKDYLRGRALANAIRQSGVTYLPKTTVWDISGGLEVSISSNGQSRILRARHVLIASGAIERPFPIPGWTLPGVMSAGAGQILLKSSGLVPAGKLVLAGCGPLLWLLAAQYMQAGVKIEALLDTTPRSNRVKALPYFPAFLSSLYALKGIGLLARVRAGTTVISNIARFEAQGVKNLNNIGYTTAKGNEGTLEADTLLLHHGVVPNLNLASSMGCELEWNEVQRCFQPKVDRWFQSSISGVSIIGDGAGIGGAIVAEERGRIAAVSVATRLSVIDAKRRDALAAPAFASLAKAMRGRAFLDHLYRPADVFRIPADDTLACRCEEVKAGAIRMAARDGATGPNQVKAFVRAGMGACQGRMCGLSVTELISQERGCSPAEVGYMRVRSPIKPMTLGELATMPANSWNDPAAGSQ